MSIFVVDYYYTTPIDMDAHIKNNEVIRYGQSFIGKAGDLVAAKFYLRKYGSPAGNIYAKLFAHSGNFGKSSVGTGSALATSDAIDITILNTYPYSPILFNFTGAEQYTLIEDEKYCIVVEYDGGDNNNYLICGHVQNAEEFHNGNRTSYHETLGTWGYLAADDVIFYVYAEGTPPVDTANEIQSIHQPIKLSTTKEINGAWTADVEFEHQSVNCEQYIDIDDEKYLVKIPTELRGRDGAITKLKCWHIGMAELGDATIDRFNMKDSVSDFLDMILADTDWSAGTCDISETVYLATDRRTSVLEVLNILADRCGGELYFNSSDRTVDLKREIGTFTGLHIRYDKNSDYILKEQDSTNLITRIYPIGADNYLPYQTTISYCEDPTDFTFSGAGTAEASTDKMFGSQATQLNFAAIEETATIDLGAGGTIDLSGHDTVEFWIYSATDNASGVTFGIGEAVWSEFAVGTGALSAGCWHKVELDMSAYADADKDAIRYVGFKNWTNGAATVIVNGIRGFSDVAYIDSPYIDNYKVHKEFTYRHSAQPEKEEFEVIIYPSDDTQAAQSAPNQNWNWRTILGIRDNGSDDKIGFIKFGDLTDIPTGATITGATLNMKVTATQFSSGGSPDIQLADADWDESTLTWNNMPGSDGNVTTFDGNSTGWKEITLTDTVDDWFNGVTDNYGLRLQLNITDVDKDINIATKESSDKPYLKVTYTMTTDPSDVIVAAATKYLHDHHEPAVRYEVNMADLSRVMETTWEDETINIGDTVKVYDSELKLNVYVRVYKITKNLLDSSDVKLELANRAYTIAEVEASREKQLSYAMPCKDNPRIIDASAIQVGYLGSDVQL